jgi:hypothetical protein
MRYVTHYLRATTQEIAAMKRGPKPIGDHTMTAAERQARYRMAHAEGAPKIRYRRPADRRSKPKQWDDAVSTLLDILDDYQDWRDRLPPGLADSATADRLDEVLALRDLVEQLQGVELPKGFGRD